MSRNDPSFSSDEMQAILHAVQSYIGELADILRTETDPLTIRAATEELKLARRARKKLNRVLNDDEPTPHADRLIRSLPKAWGIKNG